MIPPIPASQPSPHILWASPFVLILLAIAVMPMLPRLAHWWEDNRHKLLVGLVLGAVTAAYYALRGHGLAHGDHTTEPGLATLWTVLSHAVFDAYLPFIILLFSLFVISGGIVIAGDIRATPANNTAILGIGTLLASFIGTTGASMLLIRLLLATNSDRRRKVHTFVFFIFLVSNIGGSLLPIGDPPLFLGYLRGVPFFWTLNLWQPWLVCSLTLLGTYFILDAWAYRRETAEALAADRGRIHSVRVTGALNFLWLVAVVSAVATLDPGKPFPGTEWHPPRHLREAVLLAAAGLGWWITGPRLRHRNGFSFHPIGEVAALFIGIFITMQVPLEILRGLGPQIREAGLLGPTQFFWSTGLLSSFLDNAPTYVVFLEIAEQATTEPGPGVLRLVTGALVREDHLLAVSCGAVFMGANTYVGNGPNFMVKAIAESAGVRMPTFFGYMLWSAAILLPLFAVVTLIFFR